jgi:hypothetical protein
VGGSIEREWLEEDVVATIRINKDRLPDDAELRVHMRCLDDGMEGLSMADLRAPGNLDLATLVAPVAALPVTLLGETGCAARAVLPARRDGDPV